MLQSKRMNPSRIVTPRAARRIALAASVAAHALVAGLWMQTSPHPRDAATSRPRAAMTVRLYAAPMAAVTMPPPQVASLAPARPPPARPVRAKALSRPAPEPEKPMAPPDRTPPPPAAVPGAAFAGLFAPIISRPLGHSVWGRRNVEPAPAPDPQTQREQALFALRMSLTGRLNDLAARLGASGQALQCTIAIDDLSHTAEVQCTDPADQGAPWSALQGLLVAGTVATADASLCFSLVGTQVTQVTSARCAEEAPVLRP